MLKFLIFSTLTHIILLLPLFFESHILKNHLVAKSGTPLEIQFIKKNKGTISTAKAFVQKNNGIVKNKIAEKNITKNTSELIGVKQERQLKGSLRPIYPLSSRRLKEEGITKLKITIDTWGNVTEYEIISSSGFRRLDQAAIKAIQDIKYAPLKPGTKELLSSQELVFNFKLNKL